MIKLMIAVNSKQEGIALYNYFNTKDDIKIIGVEYRGQSAYEKILSAKPDVVLMNMILPELDGLGIMEQLMANLNVPKLPRIIVISSVDNPSIMDCACQMGADYYIMKPYQLETVYNRVLQLQISFQNERKNRMMLRDYSRIQKLDSSDGIDDGYLETEVTNVIRKIGIPAHVKGYQYIRTGIIMAVHDIAILNYITKLLYPAIAEEYNTTPSSVERAIRHAINLAWTRGDRKVLNDIFGYSVAMESRKPTNSEFIAQIADCYRLHYNIRMDA